MDLKILTGLLVYYGMISLLFLAAAADPTISGFTSTSTVNLTTMSGNVSGAETDAGGFFSAGVSFVRFIAFIGFGVGLPSDTPTMLLIGFMLWQTCVTILTVAFIISSIWNG